jgi:hypothetical protein
LLIILFDRQLKESTPDHEISTFSHSTSVTILRKHLYKNHIEQWVTTCDSLKIPITAKSAEEPVRIFRKVPAPTLDCPKSGPVLVRPLFADPGLGPEDQVQD